MNNRYVNICILSYNSLIKTEKKTIDGDQHACASSYGNLFVVNLRKYPNGWAGHALL